MNPSIVSFIIYDKLNRYQNKGIVLELLSKLIITFF